MVYDPSPYILHWTGTDRNGKKYEATHYALEGRLHELSEKYPEANFSSEIVHLDAEKDFCIIQVSLFIGPDYASSKKKTTATSQGSLSKINKLEAAAKARCCRDFGISTPHALASAPKKAEIDPSLKDKANELFSKAKLLNILKTPNMKGFIALATETVNESIASPEDITAEHLEILEAFLDSKEVQ